MMNTCCSKNVEAWNKHIEKECIKLVTTQNDCEMYGQQNIKFLEYMRDVCSFYCFLSQYPKMGTVLFL